MDLPPALTDLVLWVTLWATGLGVGAIVAGQPRRWPLAPSITLLAILVNAVVQPAVAWLAVQVLGVAPDAATGLILVGAASGGVLGITTTRIAGGDVRAAVALIVLLELLNLLTLPAWLAVSASGSVAPPVVEVVRTLLVLLIAPTFVGWGLARLRPAARTTMVDVAGRVARVGLVVVVVLVVVASGPAVGDLIGTAVVPVALLMAGSSLALGALLGGADLERRRMLALVTAAQSNALALAIARDAFAGRPETEAAVIVAGLVGILSTMATAYVLGASASANPLGNRLGSPDG